MIPKSIISEQQSAPIVAHVRHAQPLAYVFRLEVQYRQAHAEYCHWYDTVAAQHRRELNQMRTELNVLGWLRRGPS